MVRGGFPCFNQFVNLVNTGYMLFNWFSQDRTSSHKLQPKDFSSLYILWWKLSSFGVKKVLLHNVHLWFFVPVWILMCFDKSALAMKDFLQWTQDSDFTPRWTLMWRLNEVLCLLHLVAHFATDASGQICNQCKWPNFHQWKEHHLVAKL